MLAYIPSFDTIRRDQEKRMAVNPEPWSVREPVLQKLRQFSNRDTNQRSWHLYVPVTLENTDSHFTGYVLKYLQKKDWLLPEFYHLPFILQEFREGFRRTIHESIHESSVMSCRLLESHLQETFWHLTSRRTGLPGFSIESNFSGLVTDRKVSWTIHYEYFTNDIFNCLDPHGSWTQTTLMNSVRSNRANLMRSFIKSSMALTFEWLI